MNKTKKKIILAAIDLFNEVGLSNVRNQDIAKEASISLSNFNYHFGTKKDLVLAVFDYMKNILEKDVYGQNAILTKSGQGLKVARSYFEFERDFRFFYLDSHNILQTYPELKEEMQRQIKEAIQMIKNINYLSIGKGFMMPPPPEFPDIYDRLAEQIWINNHFWFAQMNIRNVDGDVITKGLEASLAITYPYLTPTGKLRLKQFIDILKKSDESSSKT